MKARLPALLLLLLATTPTVAPADTFTESGYVNITYRIGASSTLYGVEAADILGNFLLNEIVIGKGGAPAFQDSGTFSVADAGTVESPRALGAVDIRNGTLDVNGSIVSVNDVGFGTGGDDPTFGHMSILLSAVLGSVNVGPGSTLGCQASEISQLTVQNGGHAQLGGCLLRAVSTGDLAVLSIDGGTINAAFPDFRGAVSVDGTEITSVGGTIVDGLIQIGVTSGGVNWDASATITVGQNVHTTDMIVYNSTIESGTAIVRGGGLTDLELQGASLWRTINLFQFLGGTVTADVNSASRIESLGDLWIGASQVTVRSGVGTDSHIDVAGDLDLGRSTASVVTIGTLTIEDGGYVDVGGTLIIHPLATLNLNGGTLRVSALDEQGTLNRNGGTLIVPEPADAAALAAGLALAWLRRRT